MAGTLGKVINLVSNMGWRYVSFRARHELLRRSGLLKAKFPPAPAYEQYVTLGDWKKQNTHFFFQSREALSIPRDPQPALKDTIDNIEQGKLLLFNSVLTDLGKEYDWVTNPDSGFRYDASKHWTEIADYSKAAGDIKYVWEKSRFSYLYDIIRYDYHFNDDKAELVFRDILSWIKSNPVNCGPNYRCSQEMSLRVLNWTFALHYYRNSPHLTEEVFNQVQYAIYWHMDHVYKNIDFSRIAVRNNHAITETLALYLVGTLYPTMMDAAMWKKNAKAWFEEEIAYQVYNDGTFLQFSMNYHRVVVQLMTWAITLAAKNNDRFSNAVYDRADRSLTFLRICMIDECGWLPNYGANDGALFFKLNSGHYRDYRGQLQALAIALGKDLGMPSEDTQWYGMANHAANVWRPGDGIYSFDKGGYYIIREPDTLTFIKCGSYKDRPSQADNLHMDVWYKGENLLLDAGSYKYNTDAPTMRYFSGTRSHNTVMLGDNDQMLKGGHFIWFYWTEKRWAKLSKEADAYVFEGRVNAFKQLTFWGNTDHERKVVKRIGVPVWEIRDEIRDAPADVEMRQLWHMPAGNDKLVIAAKNEAGGAIATEKGEGWYSSHYGRKDRSDEVCFSSKERTVNTLIKVVE